MASSEDGKWNVVVVFFNCIKKKEEIKKVVQKLSSFCFGVERGRDLFSKEIEIGVWFRGFKGRTQSDCQVAAVSTQRTTSERIFHGSGIQNGFEVSWCGLQVLPLSNT